MRKDVHFNCKLKTIKTMDEDTLKYLAGCVVVVCVVGRHTGDPKDKDGERSNAERFFK